jgi:hypothetical protein
LRRWHQGPEERGLPVLHAPPACWASDRRQLTLYDNRDECQIANALTEADYCWKTGNTEITLNALP